MYNDTKRREEILSRVTVEKDTCQDDYESRKSYKIEGSVFKYAHGRPLPKENAESAIKYISILMKRFPFQLRYTLGQPLWRRFCKEWCDTGDMSKSMAAI
jgi:hypothetical protein